MRILIVGSGLIGVSTAYFLRSRGFEVAVLDRRDGPGRETSFANAGLLTPSMSGPWNAPGCGLLLLGSLINPHSALRLRLRALPSLIGWGVQFLRNSTAARYERHTRSNLRLALYSLKVMEGLRAQSSLQYDRSATGTLAVFRDAERLEQGYEAARALSSAGLISRRLSSDEAVRLEPALEPLRRQLVGALHHPSDEAGDALRFCEELAAHAQREGVSFRFRTVVSELVHRSGRVEAVIGGGRRFVADCYVIACGSFSAGLLKGVGVHLPTRPVKGYSVTFENGAVGCLLRMPIVDDRSHTVVTPLAGAIRMVSTAEFAGFDSQLNARRIRRLQLTASTLFPEARFDEAPAKPWCGLRPVSVDGVPIISRTRVPNLFVNTGHGHLGWTMAGGSAQLLADMISGNHPSIDPSPYDLKRFA